METKLASCIGFSIRLAEKCGQVHLVPHLQKAMCTLVGDAARRGGTVGRRTGERRRIFLFEALHLDSPDREFRKSHDPLVNSCALRPVKTS